MLRDRAAILTGLGLGAGLMYFFDPERGRRRRALVRDQMAHGTRITRDAAGATSRDMAHRASGTVSRRSAAGSAEGRSMIRCSSSESGRVLAESSRIRTRWMSRLTAGL